MQTTKDQRGDDHCYATMDTCRLCSAIFKRRKKSRAFNKQNITGKLRGCQRGKVETYSALQMVYLYEGPREGFLCGKCYLKLERDYRAYMSSAPGLSARKSSSRGSTLSFKGSTSKKLTPTVESISKALSQAKYYTAFRSILSRGAAAQKAFDDVVQTRIRAQFRTLLKSNTDDVPVLQKTQSVKDFSWPNMINSVRRHMPTLVAALLGAMPRETQTTEENFRSIVVPRIGLTLAIPLYTMNPKKFGFVQAMCGVQIWRYGGGEKLFRCLNHLGVCQSIAASKRQVDKLCDETNGQIAKRSTALQSDIMDQAADRELSEQGMEASTSMNPPPSCAPPDTQGVLQCIGEQEVFQYLQDTPDVDEDEDIPEDDDEDEDMPEDDEDEQEDTPEDEDYVSYMSRQEDDNQSELKENNFSDSGDMYIEDEHESNKDKTLMQCHGQYSGRTNLHPRQIGGSVGKALDDLFHLNVM